MKSRTFTVGSIALVVYAGGGSAQPPAVAQEPANTASGWTAPRTPFGQPDLQGMWANNGATPLERPEVFAEKPNLTEEELAALKQRAAELFSSDGGDAAFSDQVFVAVATGAEEFTSSDGGTGNYNQFWLADREFDSRTSLVTDPPDGRVPLRSEVRQRMEERRAQRADDTVPASWERLGNLTRCITNGLPNLLAGYNSNYQIVQTPNYVLILQELMHEARVIPLDGRPHLPSDIPQLLGDSRGHWDGDTLVVETTNFTNKTSLRGAGENLHLTERFTRVGPDTLAYEFTVADPTTFTQPWTAMIPLKKTEDLIFEYACHEGNRGLEGILAGARAEDRAADDAATQR